MFNLIKQFKFITLFLVASYLSMALFFSFQNILLLKDLEQFVENSKNIYTHPFRVNAAARDVKQSMNSIRNQILYLGLAENLKDFKKTKTEIEILNQDIAKNMQIIDQNFLGDPFKVKEAFAFLNKWTEMRTQIFAEAQNHQFNHVKNIILYQATPIYDELKKRIDYIIQFSDQKAWSFVQQTIYREKVATEKIWIIIYTSLFLAILFGVFAAFYVLKAFHKYSVEKNLNLERIRLITDNVPGYATYLLDPKGQIISWNEGATRLHGYSSAEIIGKSFSLFYMPEELIKNEPFLNLELASKNNSLHLDGWRVKKDGTVFYADIVISKFIDESNNKIGFVKIVRDITNYKKSCQDLETAKIAADNANRARGQFLANMSHEIRTPLNGILGIAELMKDRNLTSDEVVENAKVIHDSGKNLLHILNDILDFSKIEAGEIQIENEYFEPTKLIEDTCQLYAKMARKKNINLKYNIKFKDERHFAGDSFRIYQILSNLINNAIKFTDHGEITVNADLICTDIFKNEYYLIIKVQDTGVGIENKDLSRIFDKFIQADPSTTRKYGGTGLGLSISKKLCLLMGGEIGADSTINQGSLFWFKVPLSRPKVQKQVTKMPRVIDPQNLNIKNMNILVVEDNEINSLVIGKYLTKLGHRFDIAANGKIGFKLFTQSVYDVVLMDCQMPEVDGYEATRLIRRWEMENQKLPTPIVALSAAVFPEEIEKCYISGMNHFLKKPLSLNGLLSTLHSISQKKLPLHENPGVVENYGLKAMSIDANP